MNMRELVGQNVGQYRIEGLLATGGMGQVFLGTHAYLDRPAAIKVMTQHLTSRQTFHTRFLQEARATAALRHPNIVEIYDFGEQDDLLYLVMELVTGGSLGTLLQQQNGQPCPLTLGLDVIRQAAEGLAAAHAQGIIHRDIKPDNLLLYRFNRLNDPQEHFQVKITDFGIAHLVEGGRVTDPGATIGTVTYMSPEQCRGEQVDGRSDLYSLGIVLYEVTTGNLPFQIDNFHAGIFKHVQVEPPAPRLIRPELPQCVEEIILRCLAKKPEERFQSCAALAQALANIQGTLGMESQGQLPSIISTKGETAFSTSHTLAPSPDEPTIMQGREMLNSTTIKMSEPAPSADISQQTRVIYQTSTSGEDQPSPSTNKTRFTPWPLPIILSIIATTIILAYTFGPQFISFSSTLNSKHLTLFKPTRTSAMTATVGSTAISTSSPALTSTPTATSTTTPTATSTLTPTPKPTSTSPPNPYQEEYIQDTSGTPVLDDPLIDNSKGYGWNVGSGMCQFTGGALHALRTSPGAINCDANRNFANFAFQVQMTITGGNAGGIDFRNNSYTNGYFFLFDQNGSYTFYIDRSSSLYTIVTGFSTAFYPGLGRTNKITVIAQNNTFDFYVNAQYITTVTESSSNIGYVGVDAEYINSATDVAFNNAEVWALS